MDWNILWWLLAGLLIIAGLVGTVVPALPGAPLVFAGLFFGAWIGDFETVGWVTIGILAALAALAWAIDFVAAALGARYVGAGPRAFWGATVGALVGMFFGLPGLVLGPFIGAVLGELSGGQGLARSGRAGVEFRQRLRRALAGAEVEKSDDFLVVCQTEFAHKDPVEGHIAGAPDAGKAQRLGRQQRDGADRQGQTADSKGTKDVTWHESSRY